MKHGFIRFSIFLLTVVVISSCEKDGPDPDHSVIIVDDSPAPTPFDYWLETNFVAPYNIDFKWRYDRRETDLGFITVPAEYEQSIALAHLVKYLCIEVYRNNAGLAFTKTYFPKMFILIGTWEYYNNGTFILGTAEGGKKIILAGVNELNSHLRSIQELNTYYLKTIHHEFTHILNQFVSYPSSFKEVSGTDYVADSWSTTNNWLSRGFITQYAQHSDKEDFAETMSVYIINSEITWKEQLERAGDGAVKIKEKLEIVRKYMRENFNLDIDVLRHDILQRQKIVEKGGIDLWDVTIPNE